MRLEILSPNQRSEYDSFVATHSSGSFLQSWQWGEWQEQLGRKVVRVMITEDKQILLAAQIIIMPIPVLGGHYLYSPYGPLLSDQGLRIKDEVMEFFIKELNKKFPNTLFIRIEPKQELPTTNYQLTTTPHIQPGKTLVVDLQKSPEQLLSEMHPKTRYNIKVAQRNGVIVQSELIVTPGHGLLLKEVVDLLVMTAKRQNYKTFPADYYRNLINFFGLQNSNGNCKLIIYKALLEQELLATALMIDFGFSRTYLFGGTSDTQRQAMAPYSLHWQAILDAKNNGLHWYDFWGIETATGKTPGFVRFKLGWGGTQKTYPHPSDIVSKPLWYTVYKVLRSINRKT